MINSIKSPTYTLWTLNSACGKHCTGNREVFTTYESIKGQKDGQSATVSGIGTITFNLDGNELHMKNVRHIPKISFNLLSPDQLIEDGWDDFSYARSYCTSYCDIEYSGLYLSGRDRK